MQQKSLPSCQQQLSEARQELRVLKTEIVRAARHTNVVEAARTHIINATNHFSAITLQYTNTLNITILPVVQRLLQTSIAQCHEHLQQFHNDLEQVNSCIQQLQTQIQSQLDKAQHDQQNLPIHNCLTKT